jgi:hypothetical protein
MKFESGCGIESDFVGVDEVDILLNNGRGLYGGRGTRRISGFQKDPGFNFSPGECPPEIEAHFCAAQTSFEKAMRKRGRKIGMDWETEMSPEYRAYLDGAKPWRPSSL